MGFLLLFLFTPLVFVWLALLLGICFAIIYTSKKVFKVQKEDISGSKGRLVSLTFSAWGIDIAAWLISFITLFIVTYRIPFFQGINSEWGIAHESAYAQAYIFLALWSVLYAALMLPSYFCFKNRIEDKTKRNRMFLCFILISVIIGFSLLAAFI